jgi:hypothetical protein
MTKKQFDLENLKAHELQDFTIEELYDLMMQNPAGRFDGWAQVELSRRQYLENLKAVKELHAATGEVKTQIIELTKSSERLEALTVKLKNLTWVLIALTIVTAIPAGIEVWKKTFREVPAPQIVPVSPTPAPKP